MGWLSVVVSVPNSLQYLSLPVAPNFVASTSRAHGNRILIDGETEENAFQGVGIEAGAVAFASDTIF